MSAYGDSPEYHRISDGRFVCTAPEDAKCRTTPICECENWCCCDGSPEDAKDNHDDGEHCCTATTEPGRGCWIEPWIDAGDLEDSYGGDPLDVMTRDDDGDLDGWPDGPVTCEWEGDYATWTYAPRMAEQ